MSPEHLVTVYGTSMMICAPEGFPLDTEGAAVELLGEAFSLKAEMVVIPAERLTDDFFDLRTQVAGEIVQKFANYRMRLAIVGDIGHRVGESDSLSAWVAEANTGKDLWFCPTFDDLKTRLDRRAPAPS